MKNNCILVGLTGATGAGKTTAAEFFKENGCFIIDTDTIGHTLLEPNSDPVRLLCSRFGSHILNADGSVNRKELAAKAFDNKESTKALNEICHPFICYKALQMADEIRRAEQSPVIILDAAVLLESNMDIMCSCTVCVTAPVQVRTQRIMHRDGITLAQAQSRISAQHSNEYYIKQCDYNINGDCTMSDLKKQVTDILSNIPLSQK